MVIQPDLAPLVQSSPPAKATSRIDALDMTKGALVIAMVIYHSLNYSTDYTLGFKYLPFLPPSFIIITGFLIGWLYLRSETDDDWTTAGRVFGRGIRLLALFTLLNVALQTLGGHKLRAEPQGVGYFFDHWVEIYVTGNNRLAAFSILLPIAYLLLLTPALILLSRWNRCLVPTAAVILAALCAVLARQGETPVNLALLSAGLVGTAFGQIPRCWLPRVGRYWLGAAAVYAGYVAISRIIGENPLSQLFNACLGLIAIFSLCGAAGGKSCVGRTMVTLGQYSLLSYIAQIAVLQGLVQFVGRLDPFSLDFDLEMLGVFLFLVAVAESLQWARKRAAFMDACYRAVFG